MNASSSEMRWQPGQVLLDKYRIDHVLGVGGMGAVIAATHLQLDQRVALKFVHAEIAKHPEAVQRFIREARAAAQIRSEHVVRVSDVGALEDGTPYMVMEHLEGEDLEGALTRGLPAPEVVVDYLLQACTGLLEAHQHGIVHRDLKPANLFLSKRRDGRITVKVLDFGISKVQQPGEGVLTQTSALMGSPLYMSPEQMTRPKEVDARADIWAMGVIAYEALTGRRPFDGDALPEVCGQILALVPPSVQTLRPEVSARLSAVVEKCLEKDRDARFADVSELIAALEPFASVSPRGRVASLPGMIGPRSGAALSDSGLAGSAPPPELERTQQATQGAWTGTGNKAGAISAPKKRGTGPVLAGIGAATVLALGGYFAFRGAAEPEGSAAQAGLVPEVASAAAKPETVLTPAPAKPVEAPAPEAKPAEATTAEAAPAAVVSTPQRKSAKPAGAPAKAAATPTAAPATVAPPPPRSAPTPSTAKKANPLDIDIK